MLFIYVAFITFIYVSANETPDFIYKTCSNEGLRYLFFDKALSFQEAKLFCQNLSPSGDIVKITDEATFDILNAITEVRLVTLFWLDFQRVDEDLPLDNPLSYGIQGDDFGGVGSQHPWSFFNNEPSGDGENCVAMFPSTLNAFSWFTTSCESQNILTVCSQPCENIESECDAATDYKYAYVIGSEFRSLAQESCESISSSTTLARPTTIEDYSLLSDFASAVSNEEYSYWLDYRHGGSGNRVNPLNYGLEADGFARVQGAFPWEENPSQPDFEGAPRENLCVVADAITQLWKVEECEDAFDFSIICQTPCENESPSPTQGPSLSPTTEEPTSSPSFSPTSKPSALLVEPTLSPTKEPQFPDPFEEYEDERSTNYFTPLGEPQEPNDYFDEDEDILPPIDEVDDKDGTEVEDENPIEEIDEEPEDNESEEDDSVDDDGNNGDDESNAADNIQFLLILFALSILILAAVVEVRKVVQESKNKKMQKAKRNQSKSGLQPGYQSSYLELTVDSEI